jgi:hypothetical protein
MNFDGLSLIELNMSQLAGKILLKQVYSIFGLKSVKLTGELSECVNF